MDDQKIKKDEKKEEAADVSEKQEIHDNEKKSNEHLEQKIKDLDDQLKRAVADYKNLERRSIEERTDAIRFANKTLIEQLLPAFDTLFLAEKYTKDESVKLTIARILQVLKENGIEKVETNGTKYNANTMEAVEIVDGEKDNVIEELRPGFIINGRLIRPAQVKVGRG